MVKKFVTVDKNINFSESKKLKWDEIAYLLKMRDLDIDEIFYPPYE